MTKLLALISHSLALSAFQTSYLPTSEIIPKNVNSNMTEQEFVDTINDVAAIYKPIAAKFVTPKPYDYNVVLYVTPEWRDNTINAFSDQNNAYWYVWIKGGIGRHPAITTLGLVAITCHEIGHHLGGYPKKDRWPWSSAEAQADYFAAHVCMRKVFTTYSHKFKNKLLKEWKYCSGLNQQDATICNLTLSAAQENANLLAAYWKPKMIPNYDTPDTTTAPYTITGYPNPQCRLDSYRYGAFCFKSWDDYSLNDDSANYSCERPSCWFRG